MGRDRRSAWTSSPADPGRDDAARRAHSSRGRGGAARRAGKTNREMAEQFVLSERTIETHVQHILTKLGFTSRSEIASVGGT